MDRLPPRCVRAAAGVRGVLRAAAILGLQDHGREAGHRGPLRRAVALQGRGVPERRSAQLRLGLPRALEPRGRQAVRGAASVRGALREIERETPGRAERGGEDEIREGLRGTFPVLSAPAEAAAAARAHLDASRAAAVLPGRESAAREHSCLLDPNARDQG